MKRVAADHNVPWPLVRLLTTFDIKTAFELGWNELKNGKLLNAVERGGFEILLTGDKTLEDENKIAGRSIGVVVISSNKWPDVGEYAPAITEALHKCKAGQVLPVFCGKFVPRKFRTLGPLS